VTKLSKSMLLSLLFFSTVEVVMCLFSEVENIAHCMCLRADMSSLLLIVVTLIV